MAEVVISGNIQGFARGKKRHASAGTKRHAACVGRKVKAAHVKGKGKATVRAAFKRASKECAKGRK